MQCDGCSLLFFIQKNKGEGGIMKEVNHKDYVPVKYL